MSLHEKLSRWSDEGSYERIIDELEDVPESELDLFALLQLALAYNNTDRLQESIDLLMTVWDTGEDDPVWNYYLGYALLFSGRKQEACEYLLRARELNPEIPAEAILHHCICYMDEPLAQPANEALVYWVCALVDGQREGDSVLLPGQGLRITPWIDELKTGPVCSVSLYFNLDRQGKTFFECCVGMGETPHDAVCAALGSFYLGIYTGLRGMWQAAPLAQVTDNRGRIWKAYASRVVGMGGHPGWDERFYWKMLEDVIAGYLGNGSPVYIKLYGAKNGDSVTAECRVNDRVSGTLSGLLRGLVESWQPEGFASHKVFFFLDCEEQAEPCPYSRERIEACVQKAMELFADPEVEYDGIPALLRQYCADPSLADELFAFLPELCACRAFEKLTFTDEFEITAGEETGVYTGWQVSAWHMIDAALEEGFRRERYPENAFRSCVLASSTYGVLCKAKQDDGVDLLERGGSIRHKYRFHDGYTVR